MAMFLKDDIWAYLIRGRDIRVSPVGIPQNEKEKRSKFSYKIVGLKENTSVEELDWLKEILNIKALVIPEFRNYRGTIRKENFAIAYAKEAYMPKENMVIRSKDHSFYVMSFKDRHYMHCEN